jgi:hypothetical protein
MTKENDALNAITTQNKIAEYAMSVLGMDERRADVFVKSCGDYFEWTGVQLMFKGAGGKTPAIDDPKCKSFFEREFDFLIPPKTAEEKHAAIDPALIESARTNISARGQLFKELHGSKPASAEAETLAELNKLLAKGGDEMSKARTLNEDTGDRKRDDAGRFTRDPQGAGNPWSLGGWNITRQGEIAKNDLALAQRLAKAAGSYIGATRPNKAAA